MPRTYRRPMAIAAAVMSDAAEAGQASRSAKHPHAAGNKRGKTKQTTPEMGGSCRLAGQVALKAPRGRPVLCPIGPPATRKATSTQWLARYRSNIDGLNNAFRRYDGKRSTILDRLRMWAWSICDRPQSRRPAEDRRYPRAGPPECRLAQKKTADPVARVARAAA